MKNLYKLSFIIVLACSILLFIKQKDRHRSNENSVICSFSIGADIVKQIAKGKVDVVTLIPNGADIHSYEPSAKDISHMNGKLVFINGLGLENKWLNDSISNSTIKIKKLSSNAFVRKYSDGTPDPHAWLSLNNAIRYAKVAYVSLCDEFPQYADHFKNNYKIFKSEIKKLIGKRNSLIEKTYLKKAKGNGDYYHYILISNDDFNNYFLIEDENNNPTDSYSSRFHVDFISILEHGKNNEIALEKVAQIIARCNNKNIHRGIIVMGDDQNLLRSVVKEIIKDDSCAVSKDIMDFAEPKNYAYSDSILESYVKTMDHNIELIYGEV